jgi:zinc transporter ZupT
MVGLCAHAFLEGIPLSNYGTLTPVGHEHNHLLYGIILHKAPAAFALVLLFLTADFKKSTVLGCLFLFAMMSPMGAFIAESISFDKPTQIKIMAVVIGSFLHISTTILFETDNTHQHKIPIKRVAAILVGIGFAALTVLVEHEH